jgi:catechol 2,3-dioxygenase-like lactoylglutathione lyase family enzyme
MLDHIGFGVTDLDRSKRFYRAALAPLGIDIQFEVTAEQSGGAAYAGFGSDGRSYFWIGNAPALAPSLHVAFTAPDRATVDAFHRAALAAGGRDNGGPGIRAHYHPNYYGAFVLDPDGHNVEAVCHRPE